MTWAEIKAAWSAEWTSLQQKALDLYGAAIRKKPDAYAPKTRAFVDDLKQARANLDRIKARLPPPPYTTPDAKRLAENYAAMEKRYHELAAGLYADAAPAKKEGVGIIPLLVIAGLAVGVAGISWSVSAYEYAKNLREQTALADKELTARVDASREGRTLQPTTLPEQAPKQSGGGFGWLLVGGFALAAGALVIPPFLKR